MNEREFKKLVSGVREMGAHLRGDEAKGARVTEIPDPDVREIRQMTNVSQSEFAALIGVNLCTLQNWEQKRARPTGPGPRLAPYRGGEPARGNRGSASAALKTPPSTVCSPNIPIDPYFVLSPECRLAAKKWKPQTSSRTRSEPAYKTRLPVSTNEATSD